MTSFSGGLRPRNLEKRKITPLTLCYASFPFHAFTLRTTSRTRVQKKGLFGSYLTYISFEHHFTATYLFYSLEANMTKLGMYVQQYNQTYRVIWACSVEIVVVGGGWESKAGCLFVCQCGCVQPEKT